MANHLDFIYFFLTFSLGICAFGINWSIFLRSRATVIRDYLVFHFAFTSVVTSKLFLTYIQANLPDLNPDTLSFFEYLESFIAKYLLMFAIPFFTHGLFPVERAKRLNILFAVLVGLTFVGQHFTEFSGQDSLDHYGDILERLVFSGIIFYCFWITRTHYQPQKEETTGFLMRYFLLIALVFTPLLLMDLFWDDFPFRFYPLLYLTINFIFTHHFVQNYHRRLSETTIAPQPDQLAQFAISPREAEVIRLVLQGRSNQEVADQLFISLSTVKTHLRNIYQKCSVKSRFELLNLFRSR